MCLWLLDKRVEAETLVRASNIYYVTDETKGALIMFTKSDSKKRVCVGCGSKGVVFDRRWYCGLDFQTSRGACKKKKSINEIPKV